MALSQIYVLILIIVLLTIAGIVFVKRGRKTKKLTPLGGLAFGFIIAGIIFGANRIVGYVLMGIGIALAIIDAILR